MMNQYYGRGSRPLGYSSLRHGSGRRPGQVSGLPAGGCLPCDHPANHQNGGCGCGRSPAANPAVGAHGDGCGCMNQRRGNRAAEPAREGRSGGCGCGCGHSGKNPSGDACKRLMEQIRAVDFALYETVLYLDVYPHSCEALETYHKLRAQSEALRREYEETCGPLTAFSNRSDTSWDWMDQPFPWEYDAD